MDPLAYTKAQAAALVGISIRHLERVIALRACPRTCPDRPAK